MTTIIDQLEAALKPATEPVALRNLHAILGLMPEVVVLLREAESVMDRACRLPKWNGQSVTLSDDAAAWLAKVQQDTTGGKCKPVLLRCD